MKTLLYTGYDTAYAPLAAITVPRMYDYCASHGIDFGCYTEPLIDVPNGIYWTGVCGSIKAFEGGYERVMYLDVDQLITNFDMELPAMRVGFHASKDWGNDAIEDHHFSMCGFVAFDDFMPFFKTALEQEPEWRSKPFPEQAVIQDISKRVPQYFTIHPRKVFNCVPNQVCPGNVPDKWEPGDFACHITMVGLERRIEIAKEILNEIR